MLADRNWPAPVETARWFDEQNRFNNGLVAKFQGVFGEGPDGAPHGHDLMTAFRFINNAMPKDDSLTALVPSMANEWSIRKRRPVRRKHIAPLLKELENDLAIDLNVDGAFLEMAEYGPWKMVFVDRTPLVIELLDELEIIPTSMIDISDGLSSEILHLSKASEVGFHLFEEKIPIDPEVSMTSEEFKLNSTTSALNGGEDYELLFTINQKDFEKIKNHPFLSVIGHASDLKGGCQLITGLGHQIELSAQGWQSFT